LEAIDDAMGGNVVDKQGQYVPPMTIYQDNKSTILLAENGKSSRKWMHQLNLRYFFVTCNTKKVK